MKKIQVIFPAMAILLASAGVFASALAPTITYYRAENPGGSDAAECFTSVTITPCSGSTSQCKLDIFNNGNLYRISKIDSQSSAGCVQLLKD